MPTFGAVRQLVCGGLGPYTASAPESNHGKVWSQDALLRVPSLTHAESCRTAPRGRRGTGNAPPTHQQQAKRSVVGGSTMQSTHTGT